MNYNIITWKNEYSVGLSTVDEQHKRLLDIINELNEYLKNDIYNKKGNQIYFSLLHFADVYLMKEKMLVNSINDVDYSYFREKHNAFIDKLESFKNSYDKSNAKLLCSELYIYLNELFPKYISYYTPSLIKILKEHGVK